MGSHGFPWMPMGPHGFPWVPMGPHEESWVPLGSPWVPMGSPWVPMGSHGFPWVPWDPMGSPWGPHGVPMEPPWPPWKIQECRKSWILMKTTIRFDRMVEARGPVRCAMSFRSILSRQNALNRHMEQNIFFWPKIQFFSFSPYDRL